jgi:hypothetical protein
MLVQSTGFAAFLYPFINKGGMPYEKGSVYYSVREDKKIKTGGIK